MEQNSASNKLDVGDGMQPHLIRYSLEKKGSDLHSLLLKTGIYNESHNKQQPK